MANIKKRVSKEIKDPKLIEELVNIKEEDITSSYIFDLFGEYDGEVRCNPYDTIRIPAGAYGSKTKKNKKPFTTTVGMWLFNKLFIEQELFEVFGYISYTIDSKKYGKLNSKMSYALLEDDIDVDKMDNFLEKTQVIMSWSSVLCPNYSEAMLTCSKEISKLKEQLIKKNKEALKNGDVIIAEQMEKELLSYAENMLKDDPAMDCFRSGAQGSFSNNFKNMYVMKGAIRDPDPLAKKEYEIATSNFMEGVSREEYSLFAKSLSGGPFSRNKKTQLGGYWEKLFVSAFQHIKIGPEGSDCGTKRTITVHLTDSNIKKYMYSYIVNGNTLTELTSKNMNNYIGKTVKFRFSSMCECKDYYCSKCAGNLFYRIGYKDNIGTLFAQIASVLKNVAMKAFHDSTITTYEMDPMLVFGMKE